MTSTMQERYKTFVERAKVTGDATLEFICPHCKGTILTIAAPAGDTWDSMSTCPHCEESFMKITTDSDVILGICEASGNVIWGSYVCHGDN